MPDIKQSNLKWSGQFQERTRTDYIILHHAAASQCSIEDIHRWHLNNGWLGCGYHYFVRKSGEIYAGRPEDAVGAHTADYNDRSIGVCAEGDYTKEQMPEPQKAAIIDLVQWLKSKYPNAQIKKHSDFNATACPGPNFPFAAIIGALSGTPILGPARVTMEQAQEWARSRGASDQFVKVAPVYWKYTVYGIRPEVLYAQAAKETGFGKFGGAVKPEMHNYCGLKIRDAKGDKTEDHATFPDDDTGVHAHYQHMCAYVGLAPLGTVVDPRYDLVKALPWAGTVKYVEELGGKWAPNPEYGVSIVRDYLADLLKTAVSTQPVATPSDAQKLREQLEAALARLEQLARENESMKSELANVRSELARKDEVLRQIKALLA